MDLMERLRVSTRWTGSLIYGGRIMNIFTFILKVDAFLPAFNIPPSVTTIQEQGWRFNSAWRLRPGF